MADRILQLIFIEPSYFDGYSTTFSQELNSDRDHDEILYRLYVMNLIRVNTWNCIRYQRWAQFYQFMIQNSVKLYVFHSMESTRMHIIPRGLTTFNFFFWSIFTAMVFFISSVDLPHYSHPPEPHIIFILYSL